MDFKTEHIQHLMDIGLTKLQARIYLALLSGEKSTGYQTAKNLNTPAANTYKALEALQKKGLILLDDSTKVKTYTAQPISRYLDQIELRFSHKRKIIERAIAAIGPGPVQEGIYRIENREQLYTLSVQLLEKSREIIAVDGSPLPLEQMRQDLRNSSKRGVTVMIKSYTETQIPGCEVVFSKAMGSPIYTLPIQYFHLVVPGEGYITALLDHDNQKLLYGVYTKNLFLSIVAYSGFGTEFFLTKALGMLTQGKSGREVLKEWEKAELISPSRTAAWEDFIGTITGEKFPDRD